MKVTRLPGRDPAKQRKRHCFPDARESWSAIRAPHPFTHTSGTILATLHARPASCAASTTALTSL